MADRVARIVIDPSGATAGASQAKTAFASIKTSAADAAAAMDKLNNTDLTKLQAAATQSKSALDAMAASAKSAQAAAAGLGNGAAGLKSVASGANTAGAALHGSAGSFREFVVLLREAGRGDFTRMAGSATILAQRMGAIEAIGVPLIATIGAIGGVVALVASAMISGANSQAKYQNMLEITNNTAGLSYTSFEKLAQGVASSSNITVGAAEKIASAYASTGQLSSSAISDLSDATVTFSRLTGQSADDVVKSWQKIGDDPVKFANQLADQYNLVNSAGQGLSATNIQLAANLAASGDKMGAINAIAADLKAGLKDQQDNVGYLTTLWRGLANAIGTAWGALQDWGKTQTPLQNAKDNLAALQKQKAGQQVASAGSYAGATGGGGLMEYHPAADPTLDAKIKAAQATVDTLNKQDAALAASQQAQAQQQAAARASYTAADTTYKSMIDRTTQYNDALKALNVNQAAANAELARVKGNKNSTPDQIKAAQGNADFYSSQHDNIQASLKKQYLPATNKADNDAARKAAEEAKQELERQKRADQFLATLHAQSDAAAQTPIQAEITAKTQQLENILGHSLTDNEKDRARAAQIVADATAAVQGKMEKQLKTQNDASKADNDARQTTLGLTDRQSAVQEAMTKAQNEAAKQVGDQTTAQINLEIKRAGVLAGQTYDLQQQAELLKSMGQYSAKAQQLDTLKDLGTKQAALVASNTPDATGQSALQKQYGDLAKQVYDEASKSLGDAVTATNNIFKSDFAKSISDLGDQIGGTWGKAIKGLGDTLTGIINAASGNFSGEGAIGGLLGAFSKSDSPFLKAISTNASKSSQGLIDSVLGSKTQKSAVADPLGSLSNSFTTFKGDMTSIFGKGGDMSKGIGDVLGKVGAGVKMGDQVDGFMKAIGLKSSKLGSEIGGGLGTAIAGPIGGLIGSVGLGLIGGLLKATPHGATKVTVDTYGNAVKGDSSGNNSAAITASQGAATSVGSGLNTIAQTLGAQITGSIDNIEIGERNGKWRVQTNGGDSLKTGKGAVDFGKDGEADAIQYAIEQALKQGVLTGISSFSQQVLQNATDIDAATKLAAQYEGVLHDIASATDPINTAATDLQKTFQTLATQMAANGATASDLANVEKDYAIQQKAAITTAISDLETLKQKLNGDGSGLSQATQLTDNLTQFRTMEATIKSGGTVDQSTFATLAGNIFDEASAMYGTSTSMFQTIRSELDDTNTALEANITNDYTSKTLTGIPAATDSTSLLTASNDIATQTLTVQQQLLVNSQAMLAALTGKAQSTVIGGVTYVNGLAVKAA